MMYHEVDKGKFHLKRAHEEMKSRLNLELKIPIKSVMEEAKIKYTDTIEIEEEREAFQNAWENQNFDSLRKLLKRHVNILTL